MPKLVVVWTDPANWVTVLVVAFYVVRVRRDVDRRRTWAYVTRDPAAMCSAIVLAVFLAIALADSIHYRPLLESSYAAALSEGYLWHEFGDVHLILP